MLLYIETVGKLHDDEIRLLKVLRSYAILFALSTLFRTI